MLPTNFLRQLIGFYGGNLQGVVPNYLEQAMASFARQQQQMRQVVQQTFGPFMPVGVEEMSRQNIAMMERAMSMFNPFHRPGEGTRPAAPAQQEGPSAEIDALRHEVDNLRAQLAIARAEAVVQTALAAPSPLPAAMSWPEPPAPPLPAEPAAAPTVASALAVPRKMRKGPKPA